MTRFHLENAGSRGWFEKRRRRFDGRIRTPAGVDGRGTLIPFKQYPRRFRPELGEPAPHEPRGVRKVFAEFLGAHVHHGSRGGEGRGQFANDRVDQPGFRRARQRFRLFDRMVNNLRDATIILVIHRFD
jgi:hypothetical protein